MSGAKKWAVLIALVALIAVVFAWAASRIAPKKKPPKWRLDSQEQKIDARSLEIFTKTVREWNKLKGEGATWKNPKTGEYTVRNIQECYSCKEYIPQLAIPHDLPKDISEDDQDAIDRYLQEYKCPKCGGAANPPVSRPPPMR